MSFDPRTAYVRLKRRPRPDHPSENLPVVLRCDMILAVTMEPFNYVPDDKAPVAVPKNSLALKGEAVAVHMVPGLSYFVEGELEEVLAKLKAAYEGASYMLPMGASAAAR